MTFKSEYSWLAEKLMEKKGAIGKRFFGCDAVYYRGMLVVLFCSSDEPWNGVLFPVEKEKHEEALRKWPHLCEHSILPKWLYLSAQTDGFEIIASSIIKEIEINNPLLGITPKEKKRKRKTATGNDTPSTKPDSSSLIPPHLR